MKESLQEHIEAKVINFLRDAKTPAHASQIALRIQEKREDTLQAIQRLVKNRTLKSVQEFSLFSSTGEIMAYVLADSVSQPTSPTPLILVPPPPPASINLSSRHGTGPANLQTN